MIAVVILLPRPKGFYYCDVINYKLSYGYTQNRQNPPTSTITSPTLPRSIQFACSSSTNSYNLFGRVVGFDCLLFRIPWNT